MARAGERWFLGQSPWSSGRWGPGSKEASMLGKGLGDNTPGVK
jgi:hypothetical protein